jgi:DNA-directed RNA polymerase specialized sigma24 family protein
MTTDEIRGLADKAGRQIAREYPGIDAEDVAQAALLGLYEDKPKRKEPAYIYKILLRHARIFAAKERYSYVVGTSNYLYRTKEVRKILEHAYFQSSAHEVPAGADDRLSAEVGGDSIFVSVLDIDEAWKKLSKAQSTALTRKFANGEDVESKSVWRAVEALTRHLNGHVNQGIEAHEGPGSRKAISNAEAQFVTRNQW